MTNEAREDLARELDAFMTAALSIYDVAKVLPHPYNAVADMANHWAHDFVGFAFSLQKRLDQIEHADVVPSRTISVNLRDLTDPAVTDPMKAEARADALASLSRAKGYARNPSHEPVEWLDVDVPVERP